MLMENCESMWTDLHANIDLQEPFLPPSQIARQTGKTGSQTLHKSAIDRQAAAIVWR